jgi:hypothetical protein
MDTIRLWLKWHTTIQYGYAFDYVSYFSFYPLCSGSVLPKRHGRLFTLPIKLFSFYVECPQIATKILQNIQNNVPAHHQRFFFTTFLWHGRNPGIQKINGKVRERLLMIFVLRFSAVKRQR